MPEYRAIRGKRSDLTGIRGPAELRRLRLEGPRIESLTGIERLTQLELLYIERLRSPDLGRLTTLPCLRELIIEQPTGSIDWDQLSRLGDLVHLSIYVDDPDHAARVARVPFGELTGLSVLRLSTMTKTPMRLGWLEQLAELDILVLHGFVIQDADVARVGRVGARLGQITLTPRSPAQARWLGREIPNDVYVSLLLDDDPPLLNSIHEHPHPKGTEYSLGIDLAQTWDLETNIEAEGELRRLLAKRAPDLLETIRFDTESSAVWLLSSRREDLERVAQLASGSRPRARRAPD
jgi:hypothetical protein